MAAVRPFWESLGDPQRAELLSVALPELQERAKEIAIRQHKQAGGLLPALTLLPLAPSAPFSRCTKALG